MYLEGFVYQGQVLMWGRGRVGEALRTGKTEFGVRGLVLLLTSCGIWGKSPAVSLSLVICKMRGYI